MKDECIICKYSGYINDSIYCFSKVYPSIMPPNKICENYKRRRPLDMLIERLKTPVELSNEKL